MLPRFPLKAENLSNPAPVKAFQGGAIATNDPELAEKYRNIRSSYGTRRKLDVVATCNGRFSEFQAGVGLKSLQHIEKTLHQSQSVANRYRSIMESCDQIKPCPFPFTDQPNHQYAAFSIEKESAISAIDLQTKLSDEGLHIHVAQ